MAPNWASAASSSLVTAEVQLVEALSSGSHIPFSDRLRWSCQITSALIHIHTRTVAKYHVDLKPDNVMLTSDGDAVLIDFEQRGGWVSWIAPEVGYIWYRSLIAKSAAAPKEEAGRDKHALERLGAASGLEEGTSLNHIAWTGLSPQEREAAMVFSLGKLLWCIFEGQPTIYTDAGQGMTREPATWVDEERSRRFPDFQGTPMGLRECIKKCTTGADEWDDSKGRSVHFDRERGLFVPVGEDEGTVEEGPLETQRAAKLWWEQRVTEAKAFLEARIQGEDSNGMQAAARRRPSLEAHFGVLDDLR